MYIFKAVCKKIWSEPSYLVPGRKSLKSPVICPNDGCGGPVFRLPVGFPANGPINGACCWSPPLLSWVPISCVGTCGPKLFLGFAPAVGFVDDPNPITPPGFGCWL
jgi:hypothetical protein